MKKLICLILASLLVLSFAGCGNGNDEKKESTSKKSTSAEEEKDTTTETVTLKTTVNDLVKNGARCTTEIFDANTLAHADEPLKGNLYPVTDEEFTSYEKLETFVRNTYVKELADDILAGQAGSPTIYTDVDGTLCIDTQSISNRGYFIDWTDFKISEPALNETKDKCTFTVTAAITEPGENTTPEPYELDAS
ncbi:MAG: hypothetical protein J5766_01110, partial [Clostridia bacterium]|nr:hypothetical protein [Clostridia bacterium]